MSLTRNSILISICQCLLIGGCADKSLTVSIENLRETPIQNVQVQVAGETVAFGNIAPGQRVEMAVHPAGDSGLELRFSDPVGNETKKVIGVYFTGGWSHGKVFIKVESAQISFVDESHI
ncbi:MAG: hypothetical protein ACREJC_00615 [Tepidisphaeraceae bacterium]